MVIWMNFIWLAYSCKTWSSVLVFFQVINCKVKNSTEFCCFRVQWDNVIDIQADNFPVSTNFVSIRFRLLNNCAEDQFVHIRIIKFDLFTDFKLQILGRIFALGISGWWWCGCLLVCKSIRVSNDGSSVLTDRNGTLTFGTGIGICWCCIQSCSIPYLDFMLHISKIRHVQRTFVANFTTIWFDL